LVSDDEGERPIMNIAKADILATLRFRGLHARADWVDRTLPEHVDTSKNDALLQMLGIDPASFQPVVASGRG
jgi:hypothetical protein